jgi:hypothetical protein
MDHKGDRELQIILLDKSCISETILNIVPQCLLNLSCPNPFKMGAEWFNWHQWHSLHLALEKMRVFHLVIDGVLHLAMRMEGTEYVLQISETGEEFQEYFLKRVFYLPNTVPKHITAAADRLRSSDPEWNRAKYVSNNWRNHNFLK